MIRTLGSDYIEAALVAIQTLDDPARLERLAANARARGAAEVERAALERLGMLRPRPAAAPG